MEMSHETVQSVLVDADTHTNAHTQTDAQVYTERRLKRSHVDKEKQGSEGDWGRERRLHLECEDLLKKGLKKGFTLSSEMNPASQRKHTRLNTQTATKTWEPHTHLTKTRATAGEWQRWAVGPARGPVSPRFPRTTQSVSQQTRFQLCVPDAPFALPVRGRTKEEDGKIK